MVEIKSPKLSQVEEVIGKSKISDVETIQQAVNQILKNNIDLRPLKHRHVVRLLVEDKLNKQVSDESVPRACRHCQNTLGLYEPEEPDKREEIEEEYHEFYAPQKKLK